MIVICVTTAAAVEMWSEVKDRVCVLVAEMEVACSFRVESVPIVSVSRDWARVIKACRVEIMVSGEVMATLVFLSSALASALDISLAWGKGSFNSPLLLNGLVNWFRWTFLLVPP